MGTCKELRQAVFYDYGDPKLRVWALGLIGLIGFRLRCRATGVERVPG